MKFMHRHRRRLSLFSILLLACTSSAPVGAEYNPKTGRFMQADPHGTGLVVAPHLWYHGSNPTVTVNAAYELQFAHGMNFYQYSQSNPNIFRDPTGMSVLATPLTGVAATTVIGLAVLLSGSLIDQVAQLTGSIAGYQAASSLATADIDVALLAGASVQTSVAAVSYWSVATQVTVLSAARVGTSIVATGTSPIFDPTIFSTEETAHLVLGLAIAQATVAEAMDEFYRNDTFRTWVHRHYKPDQILPGQKDLTPEQIRDAYEEWVELGRPAVD